MYKKKFTFALSLLCFFGTAGATEVDTSRMYAGLSQCSSKFKKSFSLVKAAGITVVDTDNARITYDPQLLASETGMAAISAAIEAKCGDIKPPPRMTSEQVLAKAELLRNAARTRDVEVEFERELKQCSVLIGRNVGVQLAKEQAAEVTLDRAKGVVKIPASSVASKANATAVHVELGRICK